MSVPCPHCGAMIAEDANFCRDCGSSDADGWRDPWSEPEEEWEDDFDYEAFVDENFSESPISKRTKPIWRLTAGIVLCVFLGWLLVAFG